MRVRSCASVSGTVSGIGSGTSAGSTPDEISAPPGAATATVGAGVGLDAGVGTGGALVIRGPGPAAGSFEYAGNVKSKRLSGASALNFTFAYISAGNGSLPTVPCR